MHRGAALSLYDTVVASDWVDYNGHMNDARMSVRRFPHLRSDRRHRRMRQRGAGEGEAEAERYDEAAHEMGSDSGWVRTRSER